MNQVKDEELMLAYQQGEGVAMDELIRRYKNPVFRFSLRISGNVQEAQDIAQEVFLKVHVARASYQPTGKFSTWIFSIAHNAAVSRLRKRGWLMLWPRKAEEPDELVELPSCDPSPEETVSKNETSQILNKCIQGLSFLQREALVLREYQDLDYEEIATILKKSLGTVKTLIHRARMNLKAKLLPMIEESGGV